MMSWCMILTVSSIKHQYSNCTVDHSRQITAMCHVNSWIDLIPIIILQDGRTVVRLNMFAQVLGAI